MKKTLIYSLAAIAVLGLTGAAIANANAQQGNSLPPIVQRMMERFNLDSDEVAQFASEVHQERQAEMQAHFDARLDQAVEDGKITEEQKQAILAKHDQMQEKHQELMDLSPEERKTAFGELRQEMRAWAEENGIDLGLMHMFGPMMPFGRGSHGHCVGFANQEV